MMTWEQLQAAIKALGLRIEKTGHDDEMRVYEPCHARHPDRGYFTHDRDDALGTARQFRRACDMKTDKREG